MKIRIIIGLIVFISSKLLAQDSLIVGAKNADYEGRISINSTKNYFISSPKTAGKLIEITSNNTNFKVFEKEHNTVWLEFVPSVSCLLEFKIEPISPLDDYDFVLYENSKKFDATNPLRANLSRNNKSDKSITGLSTQSDTSFVGIGPGNPFSSSIFVSKEKSYILVIDNVYGGGKGFYLSFSNKNCKEENETKSPILNVNIYEKSSKKSVSADVKIIKFNKVLANDTVFSDKTKSCFTSLQQKTKYLIVVNQIGYFAQKIELELDTSTGLRTIDIELDSIYLGKRLLVENLYFMAGSAEILRKSYPSLKQLLQVLKDNPTVQIEIQGHINEPVNGSQRKGESYNLWLSDARAKAVFDYLAKRGIDKYRMTYKGFGNTKMLYPNATNPNEMEKNRRVEIEIVKF